LFIFINLLYLFVFATSSVNKDEYKIQKVEKEHIIIYNIKTAHKKEENKH